VLQIIYVVHRIHVHVIQQQNFIMDLIVQQDMYIMICVHKHFIGMELIAVRIYISFLKTYGFSYIRTEITRLVNM
jgi:hypothetical protein